MKQTFKLIRNTIYDFVRYYKYNGKSIQAHALEKFHSVERILTIANRDFKRGGSQKKAALEILTKTKGNLHPVVEAQGFAAIAEFDGLPRCQDGGTIADSLSYILTNSELGKKFLPSRHSNRRFGAGIIPVNRVANAITIAQSCPSACNRQSGRVHIYQGKDKAGKVLGCQIGNGGFGHLVENVLVVTTEIASFKGPKERYQMYIDGGIWAYSVLLGLHAEGLAACILNWSVESWRDKWLRKVADIPENETVICLIAFGHYDENPIACRSTRLPVECISLFH